MLHDGIGRAAETAEIGRLAFEPDGGDVDAAAARAEGPAVVEAAQNAIFHLSHRERRRAVRAHVAHADRFALSVAVKHDGLA